MGRHYCDLQLMTLSSAILAAMPQLDTLMVVSDQSKPLPVNPLFSFHRLNEGPTFGAVNPWAWELALGW